VPSSEPGQGMSAKFGEFTNPHTNKPILLNPFHVRSASEVEGHNWSGRSWTLAHEEVEGDTTFGPS
jgi:hypothetical protein